MSVVLSTKPITSMLWYPFCTGIALDCNRSATKHEEGKATCMPVYEDIIQYRVARCMDWRYLP
jgi:hypothetical protein